MTYRTEFPDFDPATMPEVPSTFEDQSYHNDVCPGFACDALGLWLFIDYADPARREFPDAPRFSLHQLERDTDGLSWVWPSDARETLVFDSDDWSDMEGTILQLTLSACFPL